MRQAHCMKTARNAKSASMLRDFFCAPHGRASDATQNALFQQKPLARLVMASPV